MLPDPEVLVGAFTLRSSKGLQNKIVFSWNMTAILLVRACGVWALLSTGTMARCCETPVTKDSASHLTPSPAAVAST